MITMHTDKGDFTGESVDSIIREYFGEHADSRYSHSYINNAQEGHIYDTRRASGDSAYMVLATIRDITTST